ncbi:hypothetical protein KDL44_09090 [bacterium]|nr:hypothetical protein [bacterium]
MPTERYTDIANSIRTDTLPAFEHFARGEFAEAAMIVEGLLFGQLDSSMDLEELEVRRTYLRFLILFMKYEFEGNWECRAVRTLLAELEVPLNTTLGNHERILTMIQLYVHAADACNCGLSEEQFLRLLEHEHLLELNYEIWIPVCRWAFVHEFIRPLEMAFEYLTIHSQYPMRDSMWKRVNLMLKLLRGTALRIDVASYVEHLLLVPQIMEFREDMLPVIRSHFLWDEGMEQHMLSKLAEARDGSGQFDNGPSQ